VTPTAVFEHILLDGTLATITVKLALTPDVTLAVLAYDAALRLPERSLAYPVRAIERWVSQEVGRPMRWECSTVVRVEDGRGFEVWRFRDA
jgi:hypothetical protein